MPAILEKKQSVEMASLAGVGVGLGVLGLYVIGGLVVAGWNVQEFLGHLTIGTIGSLIVAGGIAISVFAIPVAVLLRWQLVSPMVVLVLAVVGWLGYGAATGILTAQTVFGLAVYAMFLTPLYLGLYLVAGGVEYYVHS